MQLALISSETEKLLNELGFELSTGYHMTQEIARKWIRDEFEIDIQASAGECPKTGSIGWYWCIEDITNGTFDTLIQQEEDEDELYKSYELALEKGLIKFCKLIIGFSNINKN